MTLRRMIDWLERHRGLNLLFIGVYFAIIIAMHDVLANLSVSIVAEISLPTYDVVIACIGLGLALLALWILIRNGRRHRHRFPTQILLGAGTLILLLVHSRILSVMNIEAIHFLQFMFLAMLVFPLFRRVLPTLAITLIFAFADELYQYLLLYPERESYLDFNDVIMDLYGMGMGMVFLISAKVEWNDPIKFTRHPVFYIWTSILTLTTILLATGTFAFYQTEQTKNALFFFNENPPGGPFWVEFYESGISFHILSPWEGAIILLAVLGFYSIADRNSPKTNTPQT